MSVHAVNKVLLDFSFPPEERDAALGKAKSLFLDRLLPQINNRFDEIDGLLRLNRLEIDIGNTTEARFEEDFRAALDKTLRQGLQEKTGYGTVAANGTDKKEQQDHAFNIEAIVFFLKQGYWPWWLQQKDHASLLTLVATFLKDDSTTSILLAHPLLKKTYPGSLSIGQRLLALLSASPVTKRLLADGLQHYHPILKTAVAFFPVGWQKKAFEPQHFYYSLVLSLLQSTPLNSIDRLIEWIPAAYPDHAIVPDRQAINNKDLQPARVKKKTAGDLQALLTGREKQWSEFLTSASSRSLKDIPPVNCIDDTAFGEMMTGDTAKISVHNAGLVLLHPFLSPAFRDLGWVQPDGKFSNARLQQKAVLFLQYILNGKSRQPEHELVLNKILCGWPVHAALPTACNFSAKEKTAATDVLESLKESWPVMKNTSARGLVESFINRPGLIEKNDTGFIVQVEKKSIDLLLDSLPFGLNLIKLPWNEQLVYTEW